MKTRRKNNRKRKGAQPQPRQRAANPPPQRKKDFWSAITLSHLSPADRFGGWIARGTIALVIIGVLTFWAVAPRADVKMTGIQFVYDPTAGLVPLMFVTEIKNVGDSSGIVNQGLIVLRYSVGGQRTLPARPAYDGDSISENFVGAIAPEEIRTGMYMPRTAAGQRLFNRFQMEGLEKGESQLWMYGYLTYSDKFSWIFGNRRSGFCFAYDRYSQAVTQCGNEGKNYVY